MSSGAILGKGTKFGYADTAEGAPTYFAEAKSVKPSEWSVGDVDVTHYGSTDMKETIPAGLPEYSPIDVELNYLKAERTTIQTLKGVKKFWTTLYPDGSTEKHEGYINKVGAEIPLDDVIKQTITIKPTSKVDFTAGTGS